MRFGTIFMGRGRRGAVWVAEVVEEGRVAHGIRVVISVAFKHQLPISPKMEALIIPGTLWDTPVSHLLQG